MYFKIVKEVLERGISDCVAEYNISRDEVLTRMRSHIDNTQKQHYELDPEIEYGDPLCRLGYLHRHAGINATLFERVLKEDQALQTTITDAETRGRLRVCSVGGGPGTELLGLAKYLLHQPWKIPQRIDFTVLDNVYHWAETWEQLAEAAEGVLEAELGSDRPTVSQGFLSFDVFDPSSYEGFPSMFNDADIVVCNYLFSENPENLNDAKRAIFRLNQLVSDGCTFVVIDRHENKTGFVDNVTSIFESGFGPVNVSAFDGIMDHDEQSSAFGEELLSSLGYPRVNFRVFGNGLPRVFRITAQKQGLPW